MGWFFSQRAPEQIAADIAAWEAEQDRLANRSKLQAWWEDHAQFWVILLAFSMIPTSIGVLAFIGLASLF